MTSAQLKTIRLKLGLTQEQLAERLEVNRSTVTKWETGQHGINGRTATLIKSLKPS